MRALFALVATLSIASPAAAQDEVDDFPGGSYFYDAGAIGFVYLPAALAIGVELALDPPDRPRMFASDEGGALSAGNTVPELYVVIGGSAIAAGIFAPIREGRWFHLEGMAQSVSLTLALTSIGKNIFGRRRPFWKDGDARPDSRKSFPSGHSSTAFSIATYSCLFLNREAELDLVRGLGCAAILAAAGLTAYSRVFDKRHHLSDVFAGALLGTGVSMTTFIIQETRYRDRR